MVANADEPGRIVNIRNRETELELEPSDKPIRVRIITVVKDGCQYVALPKGAKIRHKPLTPTTKKA